jgi:hypothetical protein
MKRRWIKMPDGRLIEPSPDGLAVFLAQHQLDAYAVPLPIDLPRDADALPSRERDYNTESFDIRKLAGREVTILGAGSVAGYLSFFLGPARLVQNVIDFKKVERRHTEGGRTIYDPLLIGLKKVDAVKQKIEHDFPGTKVNPYPYNVGEIPDIELRTMFSRSLVVILAIDDPAQILRVSDLAYFVTEIVQVAMHRRAESGHIALSVPFVTPCLRCTLGIDSAKDVTQLDAEPASGLDIAVVAQQAARITLDIAYSKVTGRPITRWNTTKNLIWVSNTKDECSQDGPGGLTFESSRRRPGCSICDNLYGRMKGTENE